jgi:hypothetical protein
MIELSQLPTGARVTKPNATRHDFAFGRTGTVVRELFNGEVRTGVRWDGSQIIFEYPGDKLFKPAVS